MDCKNCKNCDECGGYKDTGDSLKSFTLNPRSKKPDDAYASASRIAMLVYSDIIRPVNPDLADMLYTWSMNEIPNAYGEEKKW